jgi:hypothetical protein
MVVGVLALTGCGGGGGGGGDDDPKFPNPTIDIAVGSSGADVTIKVTSMNGGGEFYNELKFNERESFIPKSRYGAEEFDEQLQYKCYVGGTQNPGSSGQIRCDAISTPLYGPDAGKEQTAHRWDDTYDDPYQGVQAWVNVPDTGTNELKYIVTAVDNPITYVIPLVVDNGVLKFGVYTTR